jgi:glycosyltransferase involved in cell wall biosynthesis
VKLAFVIPWAERSPERGWVWDHLPEGVEGELLFAAPDHTHSGPTSSKLPPYLSEFWHLSRRKPDFSQYDVVFAWELRSALATALLLKKIPKHRRPKFVAVGPILKGPVLKAVLLLRSLLGEADQIVCFSRAEVESYSWTLQFPAKQFEYWPTPYSTDDEAPNPSDAGFVLALGQSNRDYATLLQAMNGSQIPVTIVAGDESALGGGAPGENVTVKYNTGHHETAALIGSATLHVIPLHNAGFSSGQTVLLRAMDAGKACIVSDIAGVRDYVRDGETALLVPPANPDALREAILALWNAPERRHAIGFEAKRAVETEFGFGAFARRCVELARALK